MDITLPKEVIEMLIAASKVSAEELDRRVVEGDEHVSAYAAHLLRESITIAQLKVQMSSRFRTALTP